jgi:hypothetical protein
MSGRQRLALAIAAMVCAIALVACGGGGGETEASAPSPAARGAVAQANANCREMLRDVRRLAKGVLSSGYHNTLELTTEGFAKPGMKVLRDIARRQQALAPVVDDPRFDLYVGFFNPIIVLAEQRLRAGQTEDLATALNLQDRLTTLGIEQGLAAENAGLPDCEVDFLDAMVRAASG